MFHRSVFIFCKFPDYHGEGFLALQHLLTIALIVAKKKENAVTGIVSVAKTMPLISMRRYPHPMWYEDTLQHPLQIVVGLVMMLSFVYSCINIVRAITSEKEKQIKVNHISDTKTKGIYWDIILFIFLCLLRVLIPILRNNKNIYA